MKEQFVTYDIAKKLKDKKFTEECMGYYDYAKTAQHNEQDGYSGPFGWRKGECNFNKEYFYNGCLKDISNENWENVAAPLWQQVIDWFRNTLQTHITIHHRNGFYWGTIDVYDHIIGVVESKTKEFKSYEEAMKKTILKALNSI